MPDVNEGIETDTQGGGPDPNTEAGFAAALAHAVGKELPDDYEPALSADVAAGLTYGDERPGSAAVVPPAQVDTGDDTDDDDTPDGDEEEQDAPLHEDPAIAQVLSKYGGDTEKALKALADAQSLIGRRDEEREELRERLAKLEGRLEERDRQPVTQPVPVTSEEIEAVQEAVEERGGRETVLRVLQTRPELYEHALEAWAEQSGKDALAAARFDFRYNQELARARAEQEQQTRQPETDPDREFVAQQRLNAEITRTLESVSTKVADWSTVAPFMTKALDSVPRAVQLGVVGASKEMSSEEATLMVVSEARNLAVAALRAGAEGDKNEEGKRRRQAARVVSGSQRPVESGNKPLEEMTSDERIKLFKQRLLTTETTSVADGLTYAKA